MRLAQAKVFDSMPTSVKENPPKDELPSCSDTHGAPSGADAVADKPASHDDAPAAPASDDPLAFDPLIVPEPLPLAAPVLAPLPAPEPLPFADPVSPLMPLPLVCPDPLPVFDPDPPLPPEPASPP
jgi:hypothetical protein